MQVSEQVITKVKQELIAYLYDNGFYSLILMLVLTVIAGCLLVGQVDANGLLGWLIALLVTLVLRGWHLLWRRQARHPSLNWLEYEYFVGVTCTSILWGMGLLMHMSQTGDTERGILILLSCLIMAESCVSLLSSRRCVYGALLPIVLSLLLELASEPLLGLVSVAVFVLTLMLAMRRLSHWQLESLYHRFNNAKLALALRQQSDELRLASQRDGLTGLANRSCFDLSLTTAWRRCCRTQAPISLILVDVDFFKQYNDYYGHLAGDDCLRKLADGLARIPRRDDDLAARYGGEEFVLLLPFTAEAGGLALANQLREWLAHQAIPHAGSAVADTVTVSLGVATLYPHPGDQASTLIARADGALYRAKSAGRNRISVA
ncbi:diguanylate cyclase [Pseudaeromonas sp. ZJS20]|uniref:GGDEF domain-containing protein n=1 Tax=Pseudaeromonas aegiceratis TaxID=3153928 RepID=UPI00390C91F9